MSDAWLTHTNARISTLDYAALYRRTIKLSCRHCPHFRLLDAIPIWWMFERRRWGSLLKDVPAHFYCSQCLEIRACIRRNPKLEITDEGFTGAQFDYPCEREWKRLIRRHRS